MSSLHDLLAHDAIGWDFDQTLIENERSTAFHQFIRENPNKRHVIVTFRSGGFETTMMQELSRYPGAPCRQHFHGMVNISHHAWLTWRQAVNDRASGVLTGDLTEAERYYRTWKGRECKRMGLTALVDDDTVNVAMGCDLHGIVHFDALLLEV